MVMSLGLKNLCRRRNILSFGDSGHEREALIQATAAVPKGDAEVRRSSGVRTLRHRRQMGCRLYALVNGMRKKDGVANLVTTSKALVTNVAMHLLRS